MNVLKSIIERASKMNASIVLPEGQDPRVILAACSCVDRKICRPVVLGTPAEITAAELMTGLSLSDRGIQVIDYTTDPIGEELAKVYCESWNAKESKKPVEKQKMIDEATALNTLRTKRIYFGGMMVKTDKVNGLVAGSIASTGDMLRAAFHTLGTKPGIKTASSCFILDLREPTPSGDEALAFGDCEVIPDPTAEQLVEIGLASAETFRSLTGKEPRVAFLSFSTKGSASGPLVEKVQKAVELARPRFEEKGIVMDGEMQFDAAIVPQVAALKNKGGVIQGNANVLIFPDLQSGNIGYKIAQRLGGETAIGPNLQGLAKSMNDLSRGCSAEEIVGTICVTLLQSAENK